MKLTRILSLLSLAALLCSSVIALTLPGYVHHHAEGFSVKEYEDFHHVLHELQHEALPRKDFARIRSKAPELVKLGEAIVRLGVPEGVSAANLKAFEKDLQRFGAALTKFSGDAKSRGDEELAVSYSVVHESFEALADMLPQKS